MLAFKQIDIVTINVSDMTRSVLFYRDVLGFSVEKENPHRSVLSMNASPKLALHRGIPRIREIDSHEASIASIGFVVEDLEKAMEELKSRGAKFLGEPSSRGTSWVIELADPDGFHFTISSPAKRPVSKLDTNITTSVI